MLTFEIWNWYYSKRLDWTKASRWHWTCLTAFLFGAVRLGQVTWFGFDKRCQRNKCRVRRRRKPRQNWVDPIGLRSVPSRDAFPPRSFVLFFFYFLFFTSVNSSAFELAKFRKKNWSRFRRRRRRRRKPIEFGVKIRWLDSPSGDSFIASAENGPSVVAIYDGAPRRATMSNRSLNGRWLNVIDTATNKNKIK